MIRKGNGVKATAMCLALVMFLFLCACGRENTTAVGMRDKEQIDIYTAKNTAYIEPRQLSLPSQSPRAMAGDGSNIYHIGCHGENLIIHTLDVSSGQFSEFAERTGAMVGISYVYGAVSDDRLMVVLEDDRGELTMLSFDVASGALKDTADLSEINGALNGCLGYDGGLICYRSGEGTAYFYSTDGQFLKQINYNGAVMSSVSLTDGTPVACLWKNGSYFLYTMDQNGFGQRTEIDTMLGVPCISQDEFFANNGALYRLDTAAGRLDPILYWADSGLVFTASMIFIDHADTAVIYDEIRNSVFIVSMRTEEPRKVITIGAMQYGAELNHALSLFNSKSQEYVARIKLYSLEEMDRFLVDISSGDTLDIVCTGLHPNGVTLNYSTIDSGAFEDLLPYIDADPRLSREDILPQALEFMIDEKGRLYELYSFMSVSSMISSKEIAQQVSGPEDLLQLSKELPQGCALFGGISRDDFLDYICQLASVYCVDFEKGTCDFSKENFDKWLELYSYYQQYDQNTHDGHLISVSSTVTVLGADAMRQRYGEDYQYMGWPNGQGNVPLLSGFNGGYCMLASSQHKDAAWQLLRELLLIENDKVSAAILLPVMNEQFQRSLTSISALQEEGMDIRPEDTEKIIQLLQCQSMSPRKSGLDVIIKEEANKYAAGQIPVDVAVANIQSRASIYMAEQYG